MRRRRGAQASRRPSDPPTRTAAARRAAARRRATPTRGRGRSSCWRGRPTSALRNIDVERLPSLSALGAGAVSVRRAARAVQRLPTGSRSSPRRSSPTTRRCASISGCTTPRSSRGATLARADLAESQARVRTALFALRQEVNDAFFAAALLQEQLGALDGDARRSRGAAARDRRRACAKAAALPGDAAAIEATLLQQRQQADELRANRARRARAPRGADRPHDRCRTPSLALPELADACRRRAQALDRQRARAPSTSSSTARATARRGSRTWRRAADRPQLSAFGRVGYGQPGPELHQRSVRTLRAGRRAAAVEGVDLGHRRTASARRSRFSSRSSSAEEAAFTEGLRRAVADAISRPSIGCETLAADRRPHRRAARAASSATRACGFRKAWSRRPSISIGDTELLDARSSTRARHRVELAQARARVLTTLGLEVQ